MIDDLYYSYHPQNKNQLISMLDDSENPEGFLDGENTDNEYGYDENGNMISDANKGIVLITYNHLNLPIEIFFSSFGKNKIGITYLYDALGTKIGKTVMSNARLSPLKHATDYLDGFQYKNDKLQFFPTSEGYAKMAHQGEKSFFSYIYNYSDHLGNVRLSYGDKNGSGSISPVDEIVEENNYYAFGMKHEGYNYNSGDGIYKYKYQGQERQDELGLNWDSFKWRNYDYAIGRFMSIDKLAEDIAISHHITLQKTELLMVEN